MANARKTKGSNAERELINLFWENRWGAVRIAGSGSSRFPCPDVLAGNGKRNIAVECKFVSKDKKYFTKQEIGELLEFSYLFGAEPYVGIKFSRKGWYFLRASFLKKTKGMFVADFEMCKEKGVSFERLVEK